MKKKTIQELISSQLKFLLSIDYNMSQSPPSLHIQLTPPPPPPRKSVIDPLLKHVRLPTKIKNEDKSNRNQSGSIDDIDIVERIRQRARDMSGKDIIQKRILLDLPPIDDKIFGGFRLKTSSESESTSDSSSSSSSSSEWDS